MTVGGGNNGSIAVITTLSIRWGIKEPIIFPLFSNDGLEFAYIKNRRLLIRFKQIKSARLSDQACY